MVVLIIVVVMGVVIMVIMVVGVGVVLRGGISPVFSLVPSPLDLFPPCWSRYQAPSTRSFIRIAYVPSRK